MTKKLLVLFLTGTILLTGCAESSEIIECQGKDNINFDNTTIILNDGWFVNGYTIDYENKQVILSIYSEEK
jgi:uncharacterized lipoprotein YajG